MTAGFRSVVEGLLGEMFQRLGWERLILDAAVDLEFNRLHVSVAIVNCKSAATIHIRCVQALPE